MTLHYAIRRLDQLSRRKRASATTNDPAQAQAADQARPRSSRAPLERAGRAAVLVPDPASGHGRSGSRWTRRRSAARRGTSSSLDSIYGSFAPKRSDPEYQLTLRDAQLLCGVAAFDGAGAADGRTRRVEQRPDAAARTTRPLRSRCPACAGRATPSTSNELARLADITLQEAGACQSPNATASLSTARRTSAARRTATAPTGGSASTRAPRTIRDAVTRTRPHSTCPVRLTRRRPVPRARVSAPPAPGRPRAERRRAGGAGGLRLRCRTPGLRPGAS